MEGNFDLGNVIGMGADNSLTNVDTSWSGCSASAAAIMGSDVYLSGGAANTTQAEDMVFNDSNGSGDEDDDEYEEGAKGGFQISTNKKNKKKKEARETL